MTQVLKLGLISLIAFVLFISLLSLLFPSHVRISKAIDINANKDSLRSALSSIQNWKHWYPGADTMEVAEENGKAVLENRKTGQRIRIKEVTDSTVMVESTGAGLKKSSTGWNIFTSNLPNTYTIQWYMDIHLGWYPWDKFSGLLLEKRYGPSMEKGLDNLKKYTEGAR